MTPFNRAVFPHIKIVHKSTLGYGYIVQFTVHYSDKWTKYLLFGRLTLEKRTDQDVPGLKRIQF